MRRNWQWLMLLLVPAGTALGQLSLTINLRSPMPSELSAWERDRTLVQLFVNNASQSAYRGIRLSFTIRRLDNDRIVARSQDAHPDIMRFDVPQGVTVRYGPDLYRSSAVTIDNSIQKQTQATNALPEGQYELCVRLLDPSGQDLLSAPACRSFVVVIPDPPILLSPRDSTIAEGRTPVMFSWTPVNVAGKVAHYRLRIAPVYRGQSSRDALDRNQPLFDNGVQGIMVTSFLLGPDQPQFNLYPDAVGFAWQVQALDEFGQPATRNLGQSNIGYLRTPLVVPPIIIKPHLPDTLILGGWRIAVEKYDSAWTSHDSLGPGGIGRIVFNCSSSIVVVPPWWKATGLIAKAFDVVRTVTDSSRNLSLNEAQIVQPNANIGDRLYLNLPQAKSHVDEVLNKNAYIDWLKKIPPVGMRVQFRDARWIGPVKRTVILTGGVAWYPTVPPVPVPPAIINITSGFSVAIDSLVITIKGARIGGKVLLPPSLVSATTCTKAAIPLPMSVITPDCKLYASVPDSTFGPLYIGETDIEIGGRGYTIDFSSTQSDPTVNPALPAGWKGVVFKQGGTPGPSGETIVSNRGYVHGRYRFTNGLVTSPGLAARLDLDSAFTFGSYEPRGYDIDLRTGYLSLAASAISGGEFQNGILSFPILAIQTDIGARVRASYASMQVQSDMDLYADIKVPGGFRWGEFVKTAGKPRFYQLAPNVTGPSDGYFYLAARRMDPYYPVTPTQLFATPTWSLPANTAMENQEMEGATIPYLSGRSFTIFTKDIPDTTHLLTFPANSQFNGWINVSTLGVHGEVLLLKEPLGTTNLGPKWQTNPPYRGENSFLVDFHAVVQKKNVRSMKIQFVESCVWDCDFDGKIKLGGPVNANLAFKRLMFTSSANCAGGELAITQPDTLQYWGVQLVAKDTTKSAGAVCVKLGVIYLTAAGLFEPRHFGTPFYLTWGEMKASGNMGRLFFDYNNVGQKFDRYYYTPSLVRLSNFVPTDSGYVETYGTGSVGFFGAKHMAVLDWKSSILTGAPFGGRRVRVPAVSPTTGGPSDLHWTGSWASGLAALDFTMAYDSLAQDGFVGSGHVTLASIGGGMAATMKSSAESSCFSIIESVAKTFTIGPLANAGVMASIWGCGCIVGDQLERVAVGGELSTSTGVGSSILARTGSMVSVIAGFTPTRTTFELDGDMYIVVFTAGAEITGSALFVFDRGEGYVEGHLAGTLSV
ncbi:MAG: hypothetical protein WB699_18650, partial [Bacteroidota bacterium]